ncbi:hypothetical protein AUQ44_20255 [Vibrio cidicii]|uniref:Uncharacterized protein n=1 Tax=Vibrio cidicii TaxID=1763883 RepID=A0A151JEB0_9VIBR|nr:hypothetical protein AUQ44_20255 [Vibrio cidicii]
MKTNSCLKFSIQKLAFVFGVKASRRPGFALTAERGAIDPFLSRDDFQRPVGNVVVSLIGVIIGGIALHLVVVIRLSLRRPVIPIHPLALESINPLHFPARIHCIRQKQGQQAQNTG